MPGRISQLKAAEYFNILEAHQALTAARTGSVRDVLIDVSGAAGAVLIASGRPGARDRVRGVAAEPFD